MRLPNFYINNKDKFNKVGNFVINMMKELSLIAWVIVVFLLIVYSYMQNEYQITEASELSIYEQISFKEQDELTNKVYIK